MKRNILKMLETGYYTALFGMFMQITSYAYIDPSVTTYAIQAIAGIVIAVSAVVGIYWRKARRKINDTLGIDENKNKEVESEVVEIKEEK